MIRKRQRHKETFGGDEYACHLAGSGLSVFAWAKMYQIVRFKYVQCMYRLHRRKGILKNKIQWAVWESYSLFGQRRPPEEVAFELNIMKEPALPRSEGRAHSPCRKEARRPVWLQQNDLDGDEEQAGPYRPW